MSRAVRNRRRRARWMAVLLLIIAYAVYFGITCRRIVEQSTRDEAQPADAIVVFGAAEYFGKPSPVFKARLDHAYELYEQHLAPVIITTGGSGGEQKFTEGSVGRDYLFERGVGDRHLIAETQSDNSAESAVRVGTILAVNNMRSCIAVSDGYHEYRVKRLLEAEGRVVYASPRRPEAGPKVRGLAWKVAREALSYTLWRMHILHRQ